MFSYSPFVLYVVFMATYGYVHHVTPNFRCRNSRRCRLLRRPDADRPDVRRRRHLSFPVGFC